jgi:hypothetical protein
MGVHWLRDEGRRRGRRLIELLCVGVLGRLRAEDGGRRRWLGVMLMLLIWVGA